MHATLVAPPAPAPATLVAATNELLVEAVASTQLGDRRRIRALRRWFTGYAVELRDRHRHTEQHDLIERLEAVLLLWSEQPDNDAAADRAVVLAVMIRDRLVADAESDAEHRARLRAAPIAHRVAYRLTRRRYDRLVRRAFGPRSMAGSELRSA